MARRPDPVVNAGERAPNVDFDFFDPGPPPENGDSRESAPPRGEPDPFRPPLSLSLIDPPRLIYERDHEPSNESPILYRERAYLVDNLQSDEELEEQLATELAAIREDLRDRDASQYVQLALFDHEFEDEPAAPPVATLSWKDWQGRSEIWVRGVRRSSAPPPDATADPNGEREPERSAASLDESEPESESLPLGSTPRDPDASELDVGDDTDTRTASDDRALDAPKKRSDSGTSWQAPSRSGEYRIPEAEDVPGSAPSSERVLAAEELIGALFERMHELLYLNTIVEGADYIKDTLAKYIPCDGALIHVFDIDARQFVVVRALGPNSREIVALRTSGSGSHLEDALRRQTTLELSPPTLPASDMLWRTLGVEVALSLCCPMHQSGRFLGAIELGRVAGGAKFNAGQVHALEYIAEQFADFIAERPLVVDNDSIAPPP